MEALTEKIGFEKYPAYKDSGVEWLGEVPEGWALVSNRYIFNLKKEQVGKQSSQYTLLSLTLDGVIKRDMENPQGKFPAEFYTYQKVNCGDFIFCLFDVEETPRTVGLSRFDGMITGAYTVMSVDARFDKRFLYYFYFNLDIDKRLKSIYTGLRNTISKDNFFSLKTFVPTLSEQTTIASFLDRKIEMIDQAIAQKEKQIELLKERRQVLIHKAVTRGLDPDVPLKDSGIEWIGEIPEHWGAKALRFAGKTQNGLSKGAEYFGSGNPFLNYGDVYQNAELPNQPNGLANSTIEDQVNFSILEGDVFFTRTSETVEEIGVASTCLSTIPKGVFAGFLIRFRPNNDQLVKEYSKFYFRNIELRKFFQKGVNLVIRASLSQELLKKLAVLIPPKEEQINIANHLENVDRKISTAIALKQNEIEKLKEYKATLINSAVTGKIKVS